MKAGEQKIYSFVKENDLAQNISALRRILRERAGQRFIETVPKYGYRIVPPVNTAGFRIICLHPDDRPQ